MEEMIRDKKSWGAGEWQDEPDGLEFEYKGYQCFINRGALGSLNGYVVYPLELAMILDCSSLSVHGGITFLEGQTKDNKQYQIIGFDCAHLGDYIPGMVKSNKAQMKRFLSYPENVREFLPTYFGILPSQYKNIEYVTKELHSLVDQIWEVVEKSQSVDSEQ